MCAPLTVITAPLANRFVAHYTLCYDALCPSFQMTDTLLSKTQRGRQLKCRLKCIT